MRNKMGRPKMAPYGSWRSPINSDLIVSGSVGLDQIAIDGEDIYWVEMRPAEGGRYVIVRRSSDGHNTDMTPSPFSVSTQVHEYGGGSFVVSDSTIYFSNLADQRLYCQEPGVQPSPITPEAGLRYADGMVDCLRSKMICVREDHTIAGREPVNTLVSLHLRASEGGQVIVSGNDFYSSPRLSPDGSCLAWLTWNHPNMPWDGTELWVGELKKDGSLGQSKRVAGGIDESIFQPEWSPEGILHFVSDRTGWWNLYRWHKGRIEPLCEMAAEFGRPQWVFRMPTYGFESARRIICSYTEHGRWHLANLETASGKIEPIETPYTEILSLQAGPGFAVFIAGSPIEPASIIRVDLATQSLEVLQRSSDLEIDPRYISSPKSIEFPTERGLKAYAFFYKPQNRDYIAPSEERPPLLVRSHGGPTSAASTTLAWGIQYWTSRGIAVLDVDYGGSSGYGRTYRQRLNGQWGVVDVEDCVNGTRYLFEHDKVDRNRLAIHGSSAGGYTTLCALTFHKIFKAGASHYGISDLEALVKDTHKFESRYLDRLVGPYPKQCGLYQERSPIHFTDHLSCPVILFQGLEDKVVPPNQAKLMIESLRTRGVPVAYVPFESEQHGFRRAENIKRALDCELYFYSRVFGFELADPVEPVLIENL